MTGKVFSDFSKVAANDPISSKYAWFPEERGIDDVVREVDGNGNRMIAGPFFARNCCAFNGVDMGAAALVTSVGEARDLGISEDKWVYVHGVASTQDMQLQCSRASYSESIQHRVGFREAFKQAQLHNGPGDIDHFEIYSPYPCMPQLVAPALNLQLDDPRGFTVTGGHCSHGAALGGYGVTQVAAMTMKLRSDPGSFGVVNGCGGNPMTTQSFGVYSTDAPASGWNDRYTPPMIYNAEIAGVERPIFEHTPEGACTIETYVVPHGSPQAAPAAERNGANFATVVGRLPNGKRFIANTAGTYDDGTFVADPAPLKRLMEEDGIVGGLDCTVTQDETVRPAARLVASFDSEKLLHRAATSSRWADDRARNEAIVTQASACQPAPSSLGGMSRSGSGSPGCARDS